MSEPKKTICIVVEVNSNKILNILSELDELERQFSNKIDELRYECFSESEQKDTANR